MRLENRIAIRAGDGEPRAFAGDISTSESCRAIIAGMMAQEGRIEVLCNDADINRRGNLLALAVEDWRLPFAIDLDAVFPLCRADDGGAIFNTASHSCVDRWSRSPEHRPWPETNPMPSIPGKSASPSQYRS